MSRRRVWSETLPLAELGRPSVMALVARYRLELLAAVRPDELGAVPSLLRAAAESGVRVGLWPMLDDADGRWVSAGNTPRFDDLVRRVLDACADAPAPSEVAFDLEPPFGLVSRLFSRLRAPGGRARPARRSLRVARDELAGTIERVRDRGIEATAAVVPMVLFDAHGGRTPWQRALGTPVDGLRWSHVSAMTYTSIFEGWSLGALRRRDAVCLLAECCRLARERYGEAAGVSLGAVSTGALGDEPVYRSPRELSEDVAVAAACDVHDLTLFDLAGAIRRGPVEAWLEAFTAPPGRAEVHPSSRAAAVASGARALGRL